jgi:hypothetical protein
MNIFASHWMIYILYLIKQADFFSSWSSSPRQHYVCQSNKGHNIWYSNRNRRFKWHSSAFVTWWASTKDRALLGPVLTLQKRNWSTKQTFVITV